MGKFIKSFLSAVLIIALLGLIACTCWNFYMCDKERAAYEGRTYGKKILVNGSYMVYDIKGEENDTTIVLLPGLGDVSPVLQFKELSTALSDKYRVITIDPFGYGFSDDNVSDRTVSHIASDIHTLLNELDVSEYYLMAHSISGIYSLYLASSCSEEVLGFIGIDASVPKQDVYDPIPVIGSSGLNTAANAFGRLVHFLGISRLIYKISPLKDPNLTPEECEYYMYLDLNKANNPAVLDELDRSDDNIKTVRDMKFPETIPVLNFVASSNIEFMDEWEDLHRQVITETEKSEVVVLNGEHYLYLDNKDNIVAKVKEWIG